MALPLPELGHKYGNTTISGDGRAILGNDYSRKYNFGDQIQIEQATLVVKDASELASHVSQLMQQQMHFQARSLAHHENNTVALRSNDSHDAADSSEKPTVIAHNALQMLHKTLAESGALFGIASVICAFLASRHMNPVAALNLCLRIYRDSIFPLLAMIVGVCLSQQLLRQSIRPLTEISGDTVTFEDVFGLRMDLPLSYFASPYVLSGFFKAHYEGTSAEELILNGRYSPLPGRYAYKGLYSLTSICSDKLSKGLLIVMAIRYHASQPRCLECMNRLEKDSKGGYRW